MKITIVRKIKGEIKRRSGRRLNDWYNYISTSLAKKKTRVFGIGRNKTGTTSLARAMRQLGYVVGYQQSGELLLNDWAKRDFRRIIKYCKTAQFFQDAPFSFPDTYKALDKAFPGSKFILTIRDSPEQWYNSITKFHAKLWGKGGRIPTKEDLQNANYIYKGAAWEINRIFFDTPEDDPYHKATLIKHYIDFNSEIIAYFRKRPDDLLVLNVAKKDAYKMLTQFLGIGEVDGEFPWENKT